MSVSDPNIVSVQDDDDRMIAATALARSSVSTFIEALKNPMPGYSGFAVKIALRGDPEDEHVWVNRIRFDGELFHGILGNQPATATSSKLGDRASARPSEISDWMYLQGRVLVGGYTIRAIRDGLSADERLAFDRSAPFIIDSAGLVEGRDVSELVGMWELVSVDNGDGPNRRPGIRIEITEHSMRFRAASGSTKLMGDIVGTDATIKPKQVDLRNGSTLGHGIYEIDGDELKLIVCDPGYPRPSEFKGQAHGMLFALKRVE